MNDFHGEISNIFNLARYLSGGVTLNMGLSMQNMSLDICGHPRPEQPAHLCSLIRAFTVR